MVKLKMFALMFTFFLNSCIEKGYNNSYGIYIPKRPNFKLKDKEFIYPPNLKKNSIYVLEEEYYDNELIFSFKKNIWPDYISSKNWANGIIFLDFGRCLGVNVPIINQEIDLKLSKPEDFNPAKNHKEYFYYDMDKIQIESFVYGEGYGRYLIFDYKLDESGNFLTQEYKLSKSVYKKYNLPLDFKIKKIDW